MARGWCSGREMEGSEAALTSAAAGILGMSLWHQPDWFGDSQSRL